MILLLLPSGQKGAPRESVVRRQRAVRDKEFQKKVGAIRGQMIKIIDGHGSCACVEKIIIKVIFSSTAKAGELKGDFSSTVNAGEFVFLARQRPAS